MTAEISREEILSYLRLLLFCRSLGKQIDGESDGDLNSYIASVASRWSVSDDEMVELSERASPMLH